MGGGCVFFGATVAFPLVSPKKTKRKKERTTQGVTSKCWLSLGAKPNKGCPQQTKPGAVSGGFHIGLRQGLALQFASMRLRRKKEVTWLRVVPIGYLTPGLVLPWASLGCATAFLGWLFSSFYDGILHARAFGVPVCEIDARANLLRTPLPRVVHRGTVDEWCLFSWLYELGDASWCHDMGTICRPSRVWLAPDRHGSRAAECRVA